ncbi:hypothetical protein PV11_09909 [Exophiala sideris]|uniref:Uncharacterized protein n=1 Tax=Exophiala sideris TaxID=1016849 RepID=A0A0D1YTE3_9EURO|nr:hypothetical protein PV11_09909 [Exophiala sideris]
MPARNKPSFLGEVHWMCEWSWLRLKSEPGESRQVSVTMAVRSATLGMCLNVPEGIFPLWAVRHHLFRRCNCKAVGSVQLCAQEEVQHESEHPEHSIAFQQARCTLH